MERATGVEPATSSLGSWHSTTELHPLWAESRYRLAKCQLSLRQLRLNQPSCEYKHTSGLTSLPPIEKSHV